jgi:hypothetical protein
MNTYVALIADATWHATVTSTALQTHGITTATNSKSLGCEVVENQTDDYDIQELGTIDDELGVVPINKLLTSTDFIAH